MDLNSDSWNQVGAWLRRLEGLRTAAWYDLGRMRFLRFVLSRRDTASGSESGPFEVAYSLRDSGDAEPAGRKALAEHLLWFEQHLDTPSRFNRTTSKGFYRRKTSGIAWFKDTATEHVARMHAVAAILERYGRQVSMLSRARVGYVVFEDEFQVVAEPFADGR